MGTERKSKRVTSEVIFKFGIDIVANLSDYFDSYLVMLGDTVIKQGALSEPCICAPAIFEQDATPITLTMQKEVSGVTVDVITMRLVKQFASEYLTFGYLRIEEAAGEQDGGGQNGNGGDVGDPWDE